MLKTFIAAGRLHVGPRFSISFQRTLRIPDDGQTYPLPPGLGLFPLHRVEDFLSRATTAMKKHGGFFIPMYQREALWLGFGAAEWKPNAVKVGVGQVNAVSGEMLDHKLTDQPQDYMVCPPQLWLDGINAGQGYVRQFVAMPLGMGYTVEEQVTGDDVWGGIQISVFEPKHGRFSDKPPDKVESPMQHYMSMDQPADDHLGVAVGGRMTQKIYPDPYGVDTWDQDNYGSVFIHIVSSKQYRELIGKEPPTSPVSVKTYIESGLPWFKLYDEAEGDVEPSSKMAQVISITEKDKT